MRLLCQHKLPAQADFSTDSCADSNAKANFSTDSCADSNSKASADTGSKASAGRLQHRLLR